MTFQPGANVYTQGFGSAPENVQVPHIENREPTIYDIDYPIGKAWVNPSANEEYVLTSLNVSNGVIQQIGRSEQLLEHSTLFPMTLILL